MGKIKVSKDECWESFRKNYMVNLAKMKMGKTKMSKDNYRREMPEDSEALEKFKADFYAHKKESETIGNFLGRFKSIGYSIINKEKSFRLSFDSFDIDVFQSSIELSIEDLSQLLRIIKKIRLNSEFGKLAKSLKGEK